VISIVTPSSLAANPRVVKEATALAGLGPVSVVCGEHCGWAAQFSSLFGGDAGIDVCAIPYGPATRGLTRLRQTGARKAARLLLRCGWWSERAAEFATHDIVRDAERAATKRRSRLFIAHYVAALPAAARAARRHGSAYAFDAEDYHLGDLPETPEHALERRIIRAIEARYLPHAAYVSAASPLIAAAYAETYAIPLPTVILNVFPKSNAPAAPNDRGTTQPGPSLYWFSQTRGPGRGLETALAAIAVAKSRPHLYLRGNAIPAYDAELRGLAAKLGVGDRLHLLPPVAPSDLERLGASYDLGYIGEVKETTNRQIALTNKLFSYVLSGLPCIVTDIRSHRELASEFGEAMSCFEAGDATALAAALDGYLLDPVRLASARTHAWGLGQSRFNWDQEQQKLLSVVSSALRREAGSRGGTGSSAMQDG
jgi:glycosyltransferase involved in cell wall biosynthesis